MAHHCDNKAPVAFTGETVAPRVDDGAEVVRYRLEASEIEWEIAPGRTVRG
jgi:hypothetical protein